MLKANQAFRARLRNGSQTLASENSLQSADGSYFVLFAPIQPPETASSLELKLVVFEPDGSRHAGASVLALLRDNLTFMATNRRGAMLRIPVSWGKLTSRYDSLLAANIHPEIPEDRWIMFSRCRVWLVFQGYSQALNTDCLEAFEVDDDGGGIWRYHIPNGAQCLPGLRRRGWCV